ncbi:primosomal protein N' [Thermaurantiacus sp.]
MVARVRVLLLDGRMGVLDYRLPEGMTLAPGDVVEVPLGPRRLAGIVWEGESDAAVADERLRPVARTLAVPPVPPAIRRLIAFVADYYVAPIGLVARMALPSAALMGPPARPPLYRVAKDAPPTRAGPRRKLVEALGALDDGRPRTLADWARLTAASPARLKGLAEAGVLVVTPDEAPAIAAPLPPGPQLSAAQQKAADALLGSVRARAFQPFLLDGVTGSGKTEVYFEAVAAALGEGRQVLVLLPEIALTAPWLDRFRARFGFEPVVWHSGLGIAERRAGFARMAAGTARVVVGARSALFLPVARLGLIVVDESHEPAFKQEEGVPYHGRDVAVVRAREEGVPVVLASATPSLETVENVARGLYRLLSLPDRHGGASLPEVTLVDMRRTPPARGKWLAPPLVEAIGAALGRHEQALLFLNRRGYAPLTLCRACGARIQCPHCTAWMVDHRLAGLLMCHHCGHQGPRPESCPECGALDSLVACGPGVERLAEEVAARWPQARALIVTSDTVRTAADAAALQAAVAAREVDILIGTQMLAKGHDFPELTVVGVVDADLGLQGGDLRAGERSFQQVAQVAGRAGRARKAGQVFIQTHQPEAPLMQALARHDREGFLAAERALRKAAGMPPFGRLAALLVSAEDKARATEAAEALRAAAPPRAGVQLFGPAPAPLAMLRGRHRFRFLVQGGRRVKIQDWLRQWLASVKLPSAVRVSVDVDPQSFL